MTRREERSGKASLGRQLELTLFPESGSDGSASDSTLDTRAEELIDLNSATRLIVAVAEGRITMSASAAQGVHEALDVIASHEPGGRLGHVVRRYASEKLSPSRWAELVEELAFVLRLAADSKPAD